MGLVHGEHRQRPHLAADALERLEEPLVGHTLGGNVEQL